MPQFRRRHPMLPAVSLVTGGASGIGRALAAALLARGGVVVVADLDGAAAGRAATELGDRAIPMPLDVTDRAAVAEAVAGVVAEHGCLDLLANNAGVGLGGQVEELADHHWDAALDLNLGGVVNGVRAAYPVMAAQGRGVILNTASLAGLMPVPGMLPYTTTKWGVVGLSLGLRAEAAGRGVQVNVLCPSFVDTPLLRNLLDPPPSLGPDPMVRMRRLQRHFLSAEETAAAALRGIDADRAVIAVGLAAQLGWRATRLSPQLAARVAGVGSRIEAATSAAAATRARG